LEIYRSLGLELLSSNPANPDDNSPIEFPQALIKGSKELYSVELGEFKSPAEEFDAVKGVWEKMSS
jgi:hypothetical protein